MVTQSTQSTQSAASASTSELRVGVVGTGWFGNKHAEMLSAMEGVRVGAVCGSSKEKGEAMARKFGASGYSNPTEMLDKEALDAVYICVPPFAHGDLELALVERDIPFFVEKPLGIDLDVPTKVKNAVEQSNLLTSVGYHFRYMDGSMRAKELLDSRVIGMAEGGWSGDMPGVYWWRNQEQSGGQFVEQTTHIVDLVRYLMGEIVEVYAAYSTRVMDKKVAGVTVADVGSVTLKLASGAVASLVNACMLPRAHKTGLSVYTDLGVLEIGNDGLKDLGRDVTTHYRNLENPYAKEHHAFIHALRTGDTSLILSTYADAWKSQQVTVAANESAATGKPIRIR